jgi:VWFA-related protein
MHKRAPVLSLVLLSIALAKPFSAQQTNPVSLFPQADAGPNAYTLQLNVQAVVLDIVVTDSKGEVVPNLRKEDFQVFEDKVPQVIQSLDPPPPALPISANLSIDSTAALDRIEPKAPVTLIVLDEINTRFEDEAFARYTLKKFLDNQGDKLQQPTLLGAVDMQHFTLLHDYTTSKQELLDALEHHLVAYPYHMEGASWKAEQFNASFAALIEIAEATAGHPGHKSLLWVGRGFPPFDPTTLTPQANKGLKQVIEACTNALRDARVALYTLDPAGVSMEPPDVTSDGFIDDPFAGMLDFNIMAKATGGHAFFGRNDVDKLIARTSRDGANFYTLSYTPAISRADAQTYHSVRVVMRNPDFHAETREGYYSHVAPSAASPILSAKQPNRQVFDLAVAAQSVLVYDGVHMTVTHGAGNPDQFKIKLNSADLVWQPGAPHKLITKITVVVTSFDKKGTPIDRNFKISILQVGEGAPSTPDSSMVDLFATIPVKSSVERVRFVVRSDANQKLGAVNFVLGKNPAGDVSN